MTKIKFNSNQRVKIENIKQFEEIYENLRSFTKYGMSYDDWIKEYGYTLKFPIFLENNPIGMGYRNDIKDFEVLSFEEITKK